MPRATIARESPTRTMSMPAWSATCAEGKSWAVMTVMGSFLRYSDMIVGSVTFLRAGDDELPRGECDDWRMHWMGWTSLGGAAGRITGRATGRTTRSMLAVIDMVLPLVLWFGRGDSEVGRMMVGKRWKVKTKRKKGKVESSGRSSQRHAFLINNWHTGIFMRGRENIQVSPLELANLALSLLVLFLPTSNALSKPIVPITVHRSNTLVNLSRLGLLHRLDGFVVELVLLGLALLALIGLFHVDLALFDLRLDLSCVSVRVLYAVTRKVLPD
ncbi:hypothetical protein KCV03_g65, partial [Aureobasidium melanogenum]